MRQIEPQRSERTSPDQHPHNCRYGGVWHNQQTIPFLEWPTEQLNAMDRGEMIDLRSHQNYENISVWSKAGRASIQKTIRETLSLCGIAFEEPRLVEAMKLIKEAEQLMAKAMKLIRQETRIKKEKSVYGY